MKQAIHCSKTLFEMLREQAAAAQHPIVFGVPLIESNLFPFEIQWDACSVQTREEVKIPSGQFIHGVAIPASLDENEKSTLYFSEFEKPDERFKNYWLHTMKSI